MTREEKQKAIDALKISAPVMAVTQEEFNDYIHILNQVMDWLENEPCDDVMAIHTQGLDEGIRCAMCTNSMKSNRGCDGGCVVNEGMYREVMNTIEKHIVPSVTPTQKWIPVSEKYEHHIDHTDCIWYGNDNDSGCLVTCSQYRDGWNDAMDYIFKNGDGYRPYRRKENG